jgi:hypothetical protein
LRFGCFQERGWRYDWRVADAASKTLTREKLDTLWHEGIFYEPKNCTPEEIRVLEQYAQDHRLELYERELFIRNILYRSHWVKRATNWKDELREPCLVIGHNLPFDLGALAKHCGLARKDLYGGLSLKMQGGEGKYGRSVAVKKIGFGKHLFRGTKTQNGSVISEGEERARYMELVEYLDTQTLARALLGPGPSSMQTLLDRLIIPKKNTGKKQPIIMARSRRSISATADRTLKIHGKFSTLCVSFITNMGDRAPCRKSILRQVWERLIWTISAFRVLTS